MPLVPAELDADDDVPSTPAAAEICCVEYDPSWLTTTSAAPKEWWASAACNEADVGEVGR